MYLKLMKIMAIVVMMAGLSACSTKTSQSSVNDAKSLLEKAQQHNDLKSVESIITTEINSIVNNNPFDISMKTISKYSKSENKNIRNVVTSVGDITEDETLYIVKEDKPYLYSTKDTKKEMTNEQFNSIMVSASEPIYFGEFIEKSENFFVSSDDTKYILKGELYINDIIKTLQYLGILNTLEKLGINVNKIEEGTFLPVTINIGKDTNYISSININFTNAGSRVVSEAIVYMLSLPLDMTKLDLKNFSVNIDIKNVNNIASIEKPSSILE